ncbi:MAG: acetyl-CoA carboxylase carboxyl transferase subunit alpha/beta [Deltaproteobacteria bacterium]|jgi:acetyl-CoA carboxylase carboxyl transferase subunit beta|nr:acetyl-CoA carboxylase carboxyl transferase subunit alpha/beta [Deltaproteobacteria bacterium]
MDDLRKRLHKTEERLNYLIRVKDSSTWGNLSGFQEKYTHLKNSFYEFQEDELSEKIHELEEALTFIEERCEENLSPMERVRIVRSPQRFTLKDILENIYEDFTELSGEEDTSIDPSMVTAKAQIVRRIKNKIYSQPVMVIGQEKGHGEEYRNGGSCKPWGNEKALRYMRVAETEGIPIHFYIFTPGSFPVEDYPGAAQQIARNLYAMTKLRVPMISVISEGGSGGAEAIGLSDFRLMFSHGYYSVISPEGAAAIEGKIREGEKVPPELIDACADNLKITARDNLTLGTIDRVIQEPTLGAKRDDFAFFKQLRSEIIQATDEVVLKTKSLRAFRAYEVKLKKAEEGATEEPEINISWDLNQDEIKRLLFYRSKKYRNMAVAYFGGQPSSTEAFYRRTRNILFRLYYSFRYDLLRQQQKQVEKVIKDVSGEGSVLLKKITSPLATAYNFISRKPETKKVRPTIERPSVPEELDIWDTYTSPLANEDRTISCPNAAKYGCKDLWVPDLYGEFCGVCENCGHHFPLEYEWYLKHLFDPDSIKVFNTEICSLNPLNYPGYEERLNLARDRTGRDSANITFYAKVMDMDLVVSMLYNDFRNGTVGAAEGEKFVRACEKARLKRRPLLSYVHTTGGIRIHEGTLGVSQMPKCTMAVREYIDSGGLYIVVYDNNSYAGPVASFLGCSPYQFAIRSSRIGFAGSRVIRETTGEDLPPDYHNCRNALKRGHIQGIWDRRDFRKNLYKALLTMGGRNLYYR